MTFEISIKHTSQISIDENAQIGLVDRMAYASLPPEEPGEGPPIEWSGGDTIIYGALDGTIVSQVWVLAREICVNGQPLLVGGIGGVATHPDFQRRGFAEACMRRAEAYMRDVLKVPFGLLVCSEIREKYYQKLGWQTAISPMLFDCSGEKRRWEEVTMVLPLSGDSWPAGTIDLCGKPW